VVQRGLRRADVQILWQLVAVHEGLEALRWLEEEPGGALASGASSLTGSQSSLGTAEGACWPSLTPSRSAPFRLSALHSLQNNNDDHHR
jgi:hypothetical protein